MNAHWSRLYYDAIFVCVERYRVMAHGMPDLISFLDEFTRDVPIIKLSRWLGYVQGVLIERGKTTVTAERDATRPLFRPLDFAAVNIVPELLGKPLLPAKNESPLAIEAQKLIDRWNRGDLGKGEFEIRMRELIRAA